MGRKDIISKQIIRHLALDVATYLLGLDLDPASLELMETEQQRIEDRRADLVARVRLQGETTPFLLHIEIQDGNDALMPWRMLRYLSDIRLAHPGLGVRQYLIYIGRAALAMADGLQEACLSYRYGLLDMHQVDCAALLARDDPDALVLALLCDFGDRDAQTVVNGIFLRLHRLLGHDGRRLREYIDMIEILSGNRGLEGLVKEAEKMLTQVDVTRLPSYEIGKEAGVEQGLEQGREQGIQEERLRVARKLLPVLSDALIAQTTGLPLESVHRLRRQDD